MAPSADQAIILTARTSAMRARSAGVFVGRAGDSGVTSAQRRRPAFAQVMEVGRAGFDAKVELRVANVAPRDQYVDRKRSAEMGAHGRAARAPAGLGRIVGRGAVRH